MLPASIFMISVVMADVLYVRRLYKLLGYQWRWGSSSGVEYFFRTVLKAPVLEEFAYRFLSLGVPHFFFGLHSVELWKMVVISSVLFALGHMNRGLTLVMLHYLPAGLLYALIFIMVSEITDELAGYGVVMILHAAYNFIVCVGPRRMRFLGR